MKRVFLIVLDSLGIGAEPDAAEYGDVGTNTLKRISSSKSFNIPNLTELGIGGIDGIDYLPKMPARATLARVRELSRGKDTTTGHWEIAGIVSEEPMPTYPDGFPPEVIEEFERLSGRKTLCNKPYSGTAVLDDFGEEHLNTGALIVYTSADSVFQIAAHEELVPPAELYEYCRIARKILTGKHGVGRVIARPFVGTPGSFSRTANRHDFSLLPPKRTMLDKIKDAGLDVISVGKINDIFAGIGVTESNPSRSNADGMRITSEIAKRDFHGLCFVNLVDFDMVFGHRQNVDGYAAALSEFDSWLGEFLKLLGDDDALIITADHGCDPGDESTDHTREYIPMIAVSKALPSENLGTLDGFYNVGNLALRLLGVETD